MMRIGLLGASKIAPRAIIQPAAVSADAVITAVGARDMAKAEAYARRTIVNTAISWRRRRSFHERPVDVMPDVGVADRVDELATRDALWAQLQLLPPRQRAAIVLRYYLDLSEAQTAEAMGCSVGAVKSQTSAGLGRLRDRMGPEVALFTTTDQRMTP